MFGKGEDGVGGLGDEGALAANDGRLFGRQKGVDCGFNLAVISHGSMGGESLYSGSA